MSDPIILLVAEFVVCGRYKARAGGRAVIKSSCTPLLDSGRVLLAEGYVPDMKIVMGRSASGIDCLSSTIGKAAKLTVHETAGDATRFARWKPFSTCAVSPPSDLNDPEGAGLAAAQDNHPARRDSA